MRSSIFSSSDGIWISLLMRALLWPSWEHSSHWFLHREGEAKWNLTQPSKQSNPCGHLWLHDTLSESPDASKLPLLWRWAEPFPRSLSSPLSRSNFHPHFNHWMWNAIVSGLEASSFQVEQRLLCAIDKNFIHRRFYVVHGEERCFKMCVLPLASTGTSPPAFCLNWVQNDNDSEQWAGSVPLVLWWVKQELLRTPLGH